MRKIRTLAAAGVAAATVMLGLAAATPASAASICSTWNDDATYGVSCSQYDNYTYVRAIALCNNDKTVYGSWVRVGSGATSYAYCSSVGSGFSGVGGRQGSN
ncbi:hypothetical protein [Kitasatospora griseola]|uniref:hypothetical protein n=1 Tax=Kitasatospora griseola TaxID=2064 RepID=UPI00366A1760